MGSRTLYLVRHGQYVTDEGHRHHGNLTAVGRRQAKLTARRLSTLDFDALYHSDATRAAQTAEIILGEIGDLPRHCVRALREIIPPIPRRFGWIGSARSVNPEQIRRVTATLQRRFLGVPRGRQQRTHLLVAHGNLIRYLVRLALGEPLGYWLHLGTSNCGVTVLHLVGDGRGVLVSYNDVGHLPAKLQTTT